MPYGTPSLAYANSVPDQQSLYPDGQHTLVFYIKCVPPVGQITDAPDAYISASSLVNSMAGITFNFSAN